MPNTPQVVTPPTNVENCYCPSSKAMSICGEGFDRLPVQQRRLIQPVRDGVEGRLGEPGVYAVDYLWLQQGPVLAHDRAQADDAFHAGLLEFGRINRARLANQAAWGDVPADPDSLGRASGLRGGDGAEAGRR